jgi:hypothetical protein
MLSVAGLKTVECTSFSRNHQRSTAIFEQTDGHTLHTVPLGSDLIVKFRLRSCRILHFSVRQLVGLTRPCT